MAFRPPAPGALIDGKYRLAERIGGGGMGEVFRAQNVLAGRGVAVKFLHPELADNAELAQRFFQEAQAVNRIRHPNIVDVIDAGMSESGPYLVMEHLDGESIGAVLGKLSRFDLAAALAALLPVLEALDAAHRAGIIHRDLKPENVFIARVKDTLQVRLLDFGIAKVLVDGGPTPRTRTGIVFGTPDYLSPEQATGEAPLDGRSDLFAVGVLLYEMLTGVRPFRAPTAVATAFRVVHAEAPTIAAAGVQVDSRVEKIVARLLEKEPSRRYQTAAEVARDFESVAPPAEQRTAALARVLNPPRPRTGSGPLVARKDADEARARRSTPRRPGSNDSPRGSDGSREVHPPSSLPSELAATRFDEAFAAARASSAPGRRDSVSPISDLPRQSPSKVPAAARDLAVAEPVRRPASRRSASGADREPDSDASDRRALLRPFPARFAGKFQVRGPVLRAVDRAVAEAHGQKARDEVVAQLAPRWATEFRNESLNALVSYDLEALDAYLEIASALTVRDVRSWRELGRRGVEGELAAFVRPALRGATDPTAAVRRGVTTWSKLFSFGSWRIAPVTERRLALHLVEFDPASLPLRLWLVGVVEATLRRAIGRDVRVTITLGEMGFTPELACEIAVP